MESILDRITAAKRRQIDAMARLGAYDDIDRRVEAFVCAGTHRTVSLAAALRHSETGIIAEFKRRSPSKHEIKGAADPAEIIPAYTAAGASACSVLTDTQFFGGALGDLAVARGATDIPLLRKDFTVDRRQIAEARLYGADAILLIASVLTAADIKDMTRYAHQLGLEVLLEIHNEAEIAKICDDTDVIGVNNRNLGTFRTAVENSVRLASLLPPCRTRISESGIACADDITALRAAGYNGFLIGEMFMKEENPGDALAALIAELKGR